MSGPACGHSACSQNYIDTGETWCVTTPGGEPLGMGFERWAAPLHTEAELTAAVLKVATDATDVVLSVASLMAHEARVLHYRNQVYHVVLDMESEHGMGPEHKVWHLSFKRHDREPIHDWREIQAIKTAIVGAEIEAVELYPAESRVVDTANQYHLWCFPTTEKLPFGFETGLRTDAPDFGNAKQRPGSGA